MRKIVFILKDRSNSVLGYISYKEFILQELIFKFVTTFVKTRLSVKFMKGAFMRQNTRKKCQKSLSLKINPSKIMNKNLR